MTQVTQATTTTAVLSELKTMFGPLPILSTEKPEVYDAMLAGLVASHKPWDYPSKFFVWLMANAAWDILRYIRHKNWTIDRRFRQHLAHQAQRAKALAEKKKQLANEQDKLPKEDSAELDRLFDLLHVVETGIEDVDEIIDRSAKELDHARALEHGIDYIERIDVLHSTAFKRYNEAFILLQRYREVFNGIAMQEYNKMMLEMDLDRSHARIEASIALAKETGQ